MTELLNLGALHVSDFLAPGEQPRSRWPWPLKLVMDDEGLVSLSEQPPAELMWGRYWYRSGTNDSMRDELWNVACQAEGLVTFGDDDLWVDIASNDGTLLSAVRATAPNVMRIGVDPVEGEIYEQATKRADTIIQAPFTSGIADDILAGYGQAKVVTCIAMFYDLLDPTDFLAGVKSLLAPDGVFVLQLSYTPLMLEQLAFDNICHEHARYYTLTTLRHVLAEAGFRIADVELNDTNGGSFRVTCQHDGAKGLRSQPWRDVANMRIASLLSLEDENGYNTPAIWEEFAERLESLRRNVVGYIDQVGPVWAYGASTKGNTLLQYFGLDSSNIVAIAERQEQKYGLRTVGTDIPIVSEDDWRTECPDHTLILPWHFVSSFVERESKYLAAGGRFVVPCPGFRVIGPL